MVMAKADPAGRETKTPQNNRKPIPLLRTLKVEPGTRKTYCASTSRTLTWALVQRVHKRANTHTNTVSFSIRMESRSRKPKLKLRQNQKAAAEAPYKIVERGRKNEANPSV